jgi:osmotically-inducible protein OsmY
LKETTMESTTRHLAPVLLALAAVASLAGCDRPSDVERSASQSSGAPPAAGGQQPGQTTAASAVVNDGNITANVNAQLMRDATLSGTKIDVTTSNGKVVLNGMAADTAARDRAAALAQKVDGVVSVDNQLTVRSN